MIAVALAAAALASAPAPPPAVGVGLLEWEVAVYRPTVPAGRIRLNVSNLGEDTHDLVVRTRAGAEIKRVAPIAPGGRRRAEVRLRTPGRYVLFCDVDNHEARGMKARLRVR